LLLISIETPVFKGRRLQRCIESVLAQSCPQWHYSLLWDGGDAESRQILEELDQRRHPRISVHYRENQGIARARRFLTAHSSGEWILPLDDDDALPFHAVERFLAAAQQRPWAAVIRARRAITDDQGVVLDTPPWFPFERRHYQHGMVTDVFNHSQPYLIRRTAYDRTTGWEGFEDFRYAGEDCDIYLKLEEQGSIELLDEMLYYYRIHDQRASLALTDQAAFEMWRRLTDRTIARIGLPLRRVNDTQPFRYERLPRPHLDLKAVDVVVVRGDRTPRMRVERMVALLARAGAPADGVQIVNRAGVRHLNEGFRGAQRPLVCLVDAAVDLDPAKLAEMIRLLEEGDLDIAGPKVVNADGFIVTGGPLLSYSPAPGEVGEGEWDQGQHNGSGNASWLGERVLLLRREVAKAVGGVDEGFQHERAAVIDLCLKARQRGFNCGYFGAVSVVTGRTPSPDHAADLERLQRKWAAYPELFPVINPTGGVTPPR
jgi:GT2 family glycosyltransferase